jgi:hypothetical protein
VSAASPEAATKNVAAWPAVTVWLTGWVVIEGVTGTPAPFIVMVACWVVTNGAVGTLEPFTRVEVD